MAQLEQLLGGHPIPCSQPGSSRCPSLAHPGVPAWLSSLEGLLLPKHEPLLIPGLSQLVPVPTAALGVFHLILKKKILNQFIKGMWFVLSERKMPPKQLTRGCCGCGTDVLSPHNLDWVWCCTSFISLF